MHCTWGRLRGDGWRENCEREAIRFFESFIEEKFGIRRLHHAVCGQCYVRAEFGTTRSIREVSEGEWECLTVLES